MALPSHAPARLHLRVVVAAAGVKVVLAVLAPLHVAAVCGAACSGGGGRLAEPRRLGAAQVAHGARGACDARRSVRRDARRGVRRVRGAGGAPRGLRREARREALGKARRLRRRWADLGQIVAEHLALERVRDGARDEGVVQQQLGVGATRGRAVQALGQEGDELGRVAVRRRQRRRPLVDGLHDAPVALGAGEGEAAERGSEHGEAEAPDVALVRVAPPVETLGRHVLHRAHKGLRRDHLAAQLLDAPQVRELALARAREQQVLRLDVPVEHLRDATNARLGEGTLAAEQVAERAAVHVLHRDLNRALKVAHAEAAHQGRRIAKLEHHLNLAVYVMAHRRVRYVDPLHGERLVQRGWGAQAQPRWRAETERRGAARK
eukprot:5066261-Pleurochrysis_carterae.AAC.1